LFFALWPDTAVRQAIETVRTGLNAEARIVPTRNLHMTIAFLGEVTLARLSDLEPIAAQFCLPGEPLFLDQLGWFKRSRVGWLGSDSVPGTWAKQVAALAGRLRKSGFRAERRPWKPHVTLYRDLRTSPEKIPFKAIKWAPDSLCLVQSETGEKGPNYRITRHWP